jgi:hypothetical protein
MRETAAYFDREKARAQIARAIGYWTGKLPPDKRNTVKRNVAPSNVNRPT